jgi:hypothetical protein
MIATTIGPRIGRLEAAKLDEDVLNAFYDDLKAHGRKCQRCWARIRKGLPALRDGEPYVTARPGLRRRCGAPRSNGQPCQKWTRYASGRCERHGGEVATPGPDRVHQGDCRKGLPMKASSVRRAHSIISAALQGTPRKLLDHNPARDASLPKLRRAEIRPRPTTTWPACWPAPPNWTSSGWSGCG